MGICLVSPPDPAVEMRQRTDSKRLRLRIFSIRATKVGSKELSAGGDFEIETRADR
jgi:hypothetical protein